MTNLLKVALVGLIVLIVLTIVIGFLTKGRTVQAAVTDQNLPNPMTTVIANYNACLASNAKLSNGSPCIICTQNPTATPQPGVIMAGLCVPHQH